MNNRYFNYQKYENKKANMVSRLGLVFRLLAVPFVLGAAFFFTSLLQRTPSGQDKLFYPLLGASVLLYLLSFLCTRLAAKLD